MFPQKFYISKEQNDLVHTALVTGQLQDPLDLVNRSDPWVSVKENPLKEKEQEKKVLIFADKFFSNRSHYNKNEFYEKLKIARRAGFKILIPSRNEGLIEWKGDRIADNFSSEISDFNLEKTNTLALEQYQLPNKKTCVLDYFSINEWVCPYAEGQDLILMSDFLECPELLIRLLQETQASHYCIVVSSQKEIEFFFRFLEKNEFQIPTNKFKFFLELTPNELFCFSENHLETYRVMVSKIIGVRVKMVGEVPTEDLLKKINSPHSNMENIAIFLRAAPQLERLDLRFCENIEGVFSDFKKNELGHLKQIYLNNFSATTRDIAALLCAAPDLEILTLSNCKNMIDVFSGLSGNALDHLKEINLCGSAVRTQDIAILLRAAPGLEKLDLRVCKNIEGVFSGLEKNVLERLKEVELANSIVTARDIVALLKVAPELETLSLVSCENVAGAFAGLKENELGHLKEIDLSHSTVTALDMVALLKVAPELETLSLVSCENVAGAFAGFKENELGHLKEIDLSPSTVTARDIVALLAAAPGLETLDFGFCEEAKLAGAFSDLKEKALEQLKEFKLENSDVTGQDIAALLRAAPGLETFDLRFCKNIEGVFASLRGNELSQLKEISLDSSGVTAQDIAALLRAAPGLETLAILSSRNKMMGIFAGLKENSLSQLKEITLYGSSVTIADIEAILKAAPNLSVGCKKQLEKFKKERMQERESQIDRSQISRGNQRFSNFNTDFPEKTYSCVEYFPGMPPSLYRLKAVRPDLRGLQLNDVTGEGFKEYAINPDFKHQKEFGTHYQTLEGYKQVSQGEGNEIILPSLNANEVLTRLTVHDAAGQLITLPKEAIQHSDAVGFYKVILPTAGRFQIQFEVAEPLLMPVLPQNLQKKVNRYQGFKQEALKQKTFNNLSEF